MSAFYGKHGDRYISLQCNTRLEKEDWGCGSVGRVFSNCAQCPRFSPQHQGNLSVITNACQPSTPERSRCISEVQGHPCLLSKVKDSLCYMGGCFNNAEGSSKNSSSTERGKWTLAATSKEEAISK